MRQTFFAVFIFIVAVLIQCSKPVPENLDTEFQSFFTNSKTAPLSPFLQKATPEIIDSLFKKSRVNSATGTFIDTLTDTTGTPYLIGYSTPETIKKDTSYPLVIYLHGGTGTEINSKGEHAFEMLSPLQDSMKIFLVSPSASRNARWWDATGLSRILQTFRFMTLHYPIDSTKVFLAGVSDGATGCWAAANTIAGPFAGFFAVSGYGGMLPSIGMDLYPENIMQRPIYNINAGNDRLYPIEMVNKFLDYMSENGVQVFRKTYPEEQHGFDYRDKEYGTLCSYIRLWSRPTFRAFRWQFVRGVPNLPPDIFQFVINSPVKASISGYLTDDTLSIKSTGISSLVLRGPSLTQKVFISINNSGKKQYESSKLSTPAYMLIAKQRGFSPFNNDNFVSIKLTGDK